MPDFSLRNLTPLRCLSASRGDQAGGNRNLPSNRPRSKNTFFATTLTLPADLPRLLVGLAYFLNIAASNSVTSQWPSSSSNVPITDLSLLSIKLETPILVVFRLALLMTVFRFLKMPSLLLPGEINFTSSNAARCLEFFLPKAFAAAPVLWFWGMLDWTLSEKINLNRYTVLHLQT
jgi:hypothetical protein